MSSPAHQLAKREAASPARHLARLAEPFKVMHVDVTGQSIYYFLRVGAKRGTVSARSLPPEVARQVAMVTINHRAGTFNLQWHPHGEDAQVHVGLPMEKLYDAITDLAQCGFAAPAAQPASAAAGNGANLRVTGPAKPLSHTDGA